MDGYPPQGNVSDNNHRDQHSRFKVESSDQYPVMDSPDQMTGYMYGAGPGSMGHPALQATQDSTDDTGYGAGAVPNPMAPEATTAEAMSRYMMHSYHLTRKVMAEGNPYTGDFIPPHQLLETPVAPPGTPTPEEIESGDV